MHFEHFTCAKDIRRLISWHNANSEFCVLDFETTSKIAREAKLIDIQMSGYDEDHAVMFGAEYLPLLKELTCTQVGQNWIKYDWKVALNHGVDLRTENVRDTLLLAHLVDENADHDLDSMVQEEWGDDYKERFWNTYQSYHEAPFEARLDYGCRDIYYSSRIYTRLCQALKDQKIQESLVVHVHRLARSLFDTEWAGVAVDLNYTVEMGSALKADIIKTQQELRELGGSHCEALEYDQWVAEIEKYKTDKKRATVERPQFNFGSSSQVATLLYDRLKLPPQIDKKSKNRTVDDKALERLEVKHPIVPKLRTLRKYNKMHGAFIEGVLERQVDGRIYPSFNVNGTVTGRISHSDPNVGQMPSKGEWVKIRGIFVPDAGCKLITADYGQLEVCIAAHYSQDKNLLKIILEGASQHDITAEGLGIARPLAKTVNFSMQYGCTEFKIAEILNCSIEDAKLAVNKYWETYSGLKRFVDWCHSEMLAGRPIANPYGRLRRFPTKFQNHWEQESAKRQVFSSLIQGTGGDMMSDAFATTHFQLKERGWGRGWFTVHDEGLIEAKEAFAKEAEDLLVSNMLAIGPKIKLSIPLKVESSGPLKRWQK